jgi:hypothetical protein
MKNIIYIERKKKKLTKKKLATLKQPITKPKNKLSKKLVVLSVCTFLLLLTFFISYSFGFIPIGLSVIEPIGNVKTVNVEDLIEELPSMADMPNLDKIEYEAYDTDESISNICESYQNKLISEGYSLRYSGTVELDGVTFDVYGYLKGLTAVGILTTDEITDDYDSLVLYATGNAMDFREILDWYKTN